MLGLAFTMAEGYGCVGVVVDAYPTAVSFYAQYGFEGLEGQSDAPATHGHVPPTRRDHRSDEIIAAMRATTRE